MRIRRIRACGSLPPVKRLRGIQLLCAAFLGVSQLLPLSRQVESLDKLVVDLRQY
jgi:hypothetical protein